jgi:hypothetical protein
MDATLAFVRREKSPGAANGIAKVLDKAPIPK